MGSRTGSTFKSLAGRKRGSKLKSIGASISAGMQAGETAIVSSGGAVSAGSGAIVSGGGSGAGVAFVAPIAGAAALVASSKPSMDVVYHTTKLADSVLKNLNDLTNKYQTASQNQPVYSYFAKSPVEFPVNMVQSMVVDEVSDLAWANVKSELGLKTTAHQDRIAKFIISQLIGLTLNMIKQKIKGEKIDKHFFYKEVMGAAIEYCLDGFMQSNAENEVLSSNPSVAYCQMETGSQKVFQTATKEIAKELAELIYDDISSQNEFPEQKQFNRILKKRVTEKLKVEVEATEYEGDSDFKKQRLLASDQKKVPDKLDKKDVVISTQTTVNKRKIDDSLRIRFTAPENDYVRGRITPAHRDLLSITSTISKIEYLMRSGDVTNILPTDTIIYSNTDISKKTRSLVNTLASFLLTFNPNISIKKNSASSEKKEQKENTEKSDVIVLFSGGLDSLAGLEYAKKKYKNPKFVYVNNQVNRTSAVVRYLQHKLHLGDDLIIFQSQKGGQFLQQTRGFLFLSAAAVTADVFGAKEIIVAECGVTKYQPSTTISDEITKTTHRLMIELAEHIFSEFNINVKIKFPFDMKTKAEIIAGYPDKKLLIDSHSCRSSRFSDKDKDECGYCFACLLKNISLSYVLGKKQDQFLIDPITNSQSFTTQNLGRTRSLKNKCYESIFSLINFSKSMLAGNLPEPIQKYMQDYGTTKLFKNHAEDMIYGLMFMKNKGWVKNEKVLELLNKIEKESWFDKKQILERRKELLNVKT
ncbi:7-cyano-7-deazaguanine synthase [Candidatus Woesearchaeota archaeon]|nr:7-cyano-7-deazaguanine synthase [Candidatus Woesearchaeota archaeon]